MAAITRDAFGAVTEALRDGVLARDVYAAWQGVVDRAGLSDYRRHHCGYMVGIGVPPGWTGGNKVLGLRHDSDVVIRTGMSFHVLSWLMGTGRGDFFLSNTVLLGPAGAEVLTRTPTDVTVRYGDRDLKRRHPWNSAGTTPRSAKRSSRSPRRQDQGADGRRRRSTR